MSDPGFKGRIPRLLKLYLVKLPEVIENFPAVCPVDTLRAVQVKNRILVSTEADPVMFSWKKSAAP